MFGTCTGSLFRCGGASSGTPGVLPLVLCFVACFPDETMHGSVQSKSQESCRGGGGRGRGRAVCAVSRVTRAPIAQPSPQWTLPETVPVSCMVLHGPAWSCIVLLQISRGSHHQRLPFMPLP
jgi:hypothetical protein